jgi:hypothetical protein
VKKDVADVEVKASWEEIIRKAKSGKWNGINSQLRVLEGEQASLNITKTIPYIKELSREKQMVGYKEIGTVFAVISYIGEKGDIIINGNVLTSELLGQQKGEPAEILLTQSKESIFSITVRENETTALIFPQEDRPFIVFLLAYLQK